MVLLCVRQAGAMAGGPRAPGWIDDPASLEKQYPRANYFVGFGVCGGAGSRDVMSRQQAEQLAVADIAANVEVRIDDVVERHDTAVERNGKHLSQEVTLHRGTRVVTGLLSGVEIKAVYFDRRALNWHALAVLERGRGGRGAAEAIAQRLARLDAGLASAPPGALAGALALRRLQPMLLELDRLLVAVSLFTPSAHPGLKTSVASRREQVESRLAKALQGLAVHVAVTGDGDGPPPDDVRRAAETVLRERGIGVAPDKGERVLWVEVETEARTQAGAVRVVKAMSAARYRLVEAGVVLQAGSVAATDDTASRASTRAQAIQRSRQKLAVPLAAALAAELDGVTE